jgi:hypothetical protein
MHHFPKDVPEKDVNPTPKKKDDASYGYSNMTDDDKGRCIHYDDNDLI